MHHLDPKRNLYIWLVLLLYQPSMRAITAQHCSDALQLLRAEAPVARVILPDKRDAWLVIRYDDVLAGLRDERLVKDLRNALAPEQQPKQSWTPGLFRPLERIMTNLDGADHRRLRGLASQIHAALHEAPENAVEQLYAVARGYVSFAQVNPWLMREMFSGLTIEQAAYPSLYQASKQVYGMYVEVVKQGQERGEVIAADPLTLAGVLWSMLHGVAMLLIEQQLRSVTDEPGGLEKAVRLCVQTLYDGMGCTQ